MACLGWGGGHTCMEKWRSRRDRWTDLDGTLDDVKLEASSALDLRQDTYFMK